MAIFTIIGSIIGAGFASGQEIYLFFYRYGINGVYGLLLCSLLMSCVIYKVLKIVYEGNIETYRDFLSVVFKGDFNKKEGLDLGYINNIIVNVFLLITFFIMIAGFGAYFNQEFGINSILGATLIAFLTFLVFLTDIKGLTKINSIIVPILIICIFFMGVKNIPNINMSKMDLGIHINRFRWIEKAIIYASYNIILLIPILVNLRVYIKNKRNIFFISAVSGMIFFTLAISIFFMLIHVDISFRELDMPILYAIKNNFPKFKLIYGLVILISIFTTATSIGMGFIENVCKNKKIYPQVAGLMCITGLFFSRFGFSNLVKYLFPSFGFLGLLQIFAIFKK